MINSLGAGGPQQLKAPSIALNTMNRGSIDSALTGLLGKGVPAPNFSGTTKQPNLEKEKALASLQEQLASTEQQIKENKEAYDRAYGELLQLQATIKEVSQEEYEAQGLGQQFKDKKSEAYNLLNQGIDLHLAKSKISEQITDTQYGSTSQLALSALLSRRG
jgi:hypothetical protein